MYAQHHSHDHAPLQPGFSTQPVHGQPGFGDAFGLGFLSGPSNAAAQDALAAPAPAMATGGEVHALHSSKDHIAIGGTHEVDLGEHTFSTGEINSLADYVESPEELAALTPGQLMRARELLATEPLTPEQMAELTAIFPKYEALSKANQNHFGASDPDLCAPSGNGGPTNRSEILRWLGEAATLAASVHGQPNAEAVHEQALAAAAFAGHFIADAFSSGHLFNKADVMAQAQAGLEGGMVHDGLVAAMVAQAGPRIAAEGAAKLEGWRAVVDGKQVRVTGAMLTGLLGGVVATSPDLVGNSVVLAVHDQLSLQGAWVTDGQVQWKMYGDHSLDETSMSRCSALIETVYAMVQGVVNTGDPSALDLDLVLTRLPVPLEDEKTRIAGMIERATTVRGGGMEDALVHSSVALLDEILAGANDEMPGEAFVRVDGHVPADRGPTFADGIAPILGKPSHDHDHDAHIA